MFASLGNADIYLIPVCVLDTVGHALIGGGNSQLLGCGITRQVAVDFYSYAKLSGGSFYLVHCADRGDTVACQHTDGILQCLKLSLGILTAVYDVTDGQEASSDGIVNIDL